jgi:metal-responsive CopG/Arc/MetJ family transcriptional regulator
MPSKIGPLKEIRINYRVPPDLTSKIDAIMKKEGYSDKSELITIALREYLNKEELMGLIDQKIEGKLREIFQSDQLKFTNQEDSKVSKK